MCKTFEMTYVDSDIYKDIHQTWTPSRYHQLHKTTWTCKTNVCQVLFLYYATLIICWIRVQGETYDTKAYSLIRVFILPTSTALQRVSRVAEIAILIFVCVYWNIHQHPLPCSLNQPFLIPWFAQHMAWTMFVFGLPLFRGDGFA